MKTRLPKLDDSAGRQVAFVRFLPAYFSPTRRRRRRHCAARHSAPSAYAQRPTHAHGLIVAALPALSRVTLIALLYGDPTDEARCRQLPHFPPPRASRVDQAAVRIRYPHYARIVTSVYQPRTRHGRRRFRDLACGRYIPSNYGERAAARGSLPAGELSCDAAAESS